MKLVCMSDTHGSHSQVKVPNGDVLIVAGDITGWGTHKNIKDFNNWLGTLPHKHKIVIAGNHDRYLTNHSGEVELPNCTYLENSGCEIEGIKFWGSPITPTFNDWFFMADRHVIQEHWDQIPKDIDVLITHGPPYGILDEVASVYGGNHVGCSSLLTTIMEIKPRLHVFGHLHDSYGIEDKEGIIFVNCSVSDEAYEISNPPVICEI